MHNTVNFITLFRTKNKKQTVLYLSHLLAIAIVQIHVIVIAVAYLAYKQNSRSKSNQSFR